jgi:yecA family protein
MMLRTIREAAMRAQALPHAIPLDQVDLEALDRFLMSDRSPPNSMMLSDLDGFLTGIAIGPELVLPSEWLPLVWGGEAPEFADESEAKAVLGAIMSRYNGILRQLDHDAFGPIFWAARDGTLMAADWAEGFLQAIMLRMDAWDQLLKSKRDGRSRSWRSAATRTASRCSACRRRTKTASWRRRPSSFPPASPRSPPTGGERDRSKSQWR